MSQALDLWVALGVMVGLSIAAAVAMHALGARVGTAARVMLLLPIGGLLFAHLLWLRDAPVWARLLPVTGVPIYANPLPVLSAMVGGLIVSVPELPRWRALPLAATIFACGLYPSFHLLRVDPPPVDPRWDLGVALQTSNASCSPAAAATLLRTVGIERDEAQMLAPCLTDRRGTPLLGIYRGLRIATRGTGWAPVAHRVTLDELAARADALLPAVVDVKLTAEAVRREPRYVTQWGWTVGQIHSVVFFRRLPNGWYDVGDPGVGREAWRPDVLGDLWTGDLIGLEREAG